jgi:hypothetical protein
VINITDISEQILPSSQKLTPESWGDSEIFMVEDWVVGFVRKCQ